MTSVGSIASSSVVKFEMASASETLAGLAAARSSLMGSDAVKSMQSMVTGLAAAQSSLAASDAVKSMQSMVAGLAGAKWATDAKLASLISGFAEVSRTPADRFGALQSALSESAQVEASLRAVVDATQMRGSFGLDYGLIQGAATRLGRAIDEDPEFDETIAPRIASVLDLGGLTDVDVIDFSNALGIWDRMRGHRVSGTGLILAFTVCLATYVVGLGVGDLNPIPSVVWGGATYVAVSARRDR